MNSFLELLLPLFLLAVIAMQEWSRKQLLERESKDKSALLEELAKLQTALISKSSSEYAAMRAMDKVMVEEKPKVNNEFVDSSELTDDEYEKMLDLQNEEQEVEKE